MLEFKMDESECWYELKIHNAWPGDRPSMAGGFAIRIDGVVYTESTPEFIEAYDVEYMWEKLTNA